MAKRRTRKQKIQAKHQFTINWVPSSTTSKKSSKSTNYKAGVKRQTAKTKIQEKPKFVKKKMAKSMAKVDSLASIRHNLVKSLSLATIILGLELMIYLFWK
jgi:hypothetical protein